MIKYRPVILETANIQSRLYTPGGENVLIKPDSPYLFSNLTLDLQKKTSYSLRQASPQLTTFPVNKQKIRGFPQYLNKFYNGVKTHQNRTKCKPTVYHRTLRTFNPRYSVPYVLCTYVKHILYTVHPVNGDPYLQCFPATTLKVRVFTYYPCPIYRAPFIHLTNQG